MSSFRAEILLPNHVLLYNNGHSSRTLPLCPVPSQGSNPHVHQNHGHCALDHHTSNPAWLCTLFFFMWRMIRIVNAQTGHSMWGLVPADGPNQELISSIFYVVFDNILQFATNIIVVSVVVSCTLVTVIKLRQAMTWRLSANTSSSKTQNQQTALTKMLVVVCCIYVVCSTPGCIMALVRRVNPMFSPTGQYANLFILLHDINYRFFSAINSSINFFVFCWMSSRFRHELRCLCVRKDTLAVKRQFEPTKSTE